MTLRLINVTVGLDPCADGGQQPPQDGQQPGDGAGDTDATIPPALVGAWEGHHVEPAEKFPATYVFHFPEEGNVIGSSSYPTHDCRGYLQLESVSGNTVKFTEYVTEGDCGYKWYFKAELVGSKLHISYRDTPSGEIVGEGWFSRVSSDEGGATTPEVTITTPADGETYQTNDQIIADYECTDANGAALVGWRCDGTEPNGEPLYMSPGNHSFTVIATDRDGRQAQLTHSYRVEAPGDGGPIINIFNPPPIVNTTTTVVNRIGETVGGLRQGRLPDTGGGWTVVLFFGVALVGGGWFLVRRFSR